MNHVSQTPRQSPAASANTNAPVREAVIEEYLKALKLPAFAGEYRGLVRRANDGGWDYEDFLRELLDAELRSREERTARGRLKEARFPEIKTLDQLDYDALRGISKQKVAELSRCAFLTEARDCIIAGPLGTGKTHVAISIGVEAARRRFKVAFYRAADLLRLLTESRDERTLTALHRRIRRVDLLILDELGFVSFERAGGELFVRSALRAPRDALHDGHHQPRLRGVGSDLRRREAYDGVVGQARRTQRPHPDHPRRVLPDTQTSQEGGIAMEVIGGSGSAAFSRCKAGRSGSTLQRCSGSKFRR